VLKILAEAAQLSAGERVELVNELARTLSETDGADELNLDYDELERRVNDVRQGTAVVVSWDDVRKQLLSDR
jgi:putative addiction module component (TIGR02574 family)